MYDIRQLPLPASVVSRTPAMPSSGEERGSERSGIVDDRPGCAPCGTWRWASGPCTGSGGDDKAQISR
jgi:hypothetical protein